VPVAARKIAPDIFRQRLLIEGYYTGDVGRSGVATFLTDLAAELGLRAYAEPVIYSPEGQGSAENQGFDAFLPLIDSGIAAYFWSRRRFFSIVLYTCKPFDEDRAVRFTRQFLSVDEDPVVFSF
jgi:S-adenosylmethionine decarboxylase